MSTITGIQNTSYYQPTSNVGSTSPTIGSDGDNDGSGANGTVGRSGHHHHGVFSSAIMQTLSQLESGSSASSTTGSSSTSAASTSASSGVTSQQQALSTFMQDLFATLGGQNGQSPSTSGTSQGTVASDSVGTNSVSSYGTQGGLGKLVSELQSLAQQMSFSGTTSGQSTSNTSTLQSDFQNLVSSTGGSSANMPSLDSFLQDLAQNLRNGNSTGNIVNTKA